MAKSTRSLSGASKRKYLRELISSEAGVSAEAARNLVAVADKEITGLRVRLPIPERRPARAVAPQAAASTATSPTLQAPPPPVDVAVLAEPAIAEAFDPYAFSLVVVLTKEGRDGLMQRLASIDSAEHLRTLAKAQHVAVDASLSLPEELRLAILAGTEQRIADRRAAAS